MREVTLESPKTFSKGWWKNIAKAVQPWKFDAERHAIWQVSSAVSWTQFALGSMIWSWLKTSWATLIVPAAKTVGAVSVLGIKSAWAVISH